MHLVETLNAVRDCLGKLAEEYLINLEHDSNRLKALEKQLVFCQDCKFSRVNMGKGCGYFCGHSDHIINAEVHALDFCSKGVRK